ncbi:MAG: hypothetical protein ACOX40_07715 [Bacilli bacterium]|jgi:hypothetical protein
MKRLLKKDVIFWVVRIIMGILFVGNFVSVFFVKDDSQQSRLIFNSAQSLMFLLASFIPSLIERKGQLEIPDFMEIIFIAFCICHFALGEIGNFFYKFKWWDSMLHTLSGSMVAILGFSIINSINANRNDQMNLSPIMIAIFVVCFSLSIGVIWEILEFAIDGAFNSNMQRFRDTVTGDDLIGRAALVDTMKDLILDFIGAAVIAVVGYISIRKDNRAFVDWTIRKREIIIKESDETGF